MSRGLCRPWRCRSVAGAPPLVVCAVTVADDAKPLDRPETDDRYAMVLMPFEELRDKR